MQPNLTSVARRRFGAWLIYAVLGILLALGLLFMVVGWSMPDDAGREVTASGFIAMAAGILFTLALGIGLMTLIFYSNRKGHD
jgi:hypothetical protein